MTPTPTPTPVGFKDASSGIASGFGSMVGLAEAVAIVASAIVILLAISYASTSLERYERLRRAVLFVAGLFRYAAFGLGGVFVLGLLVSPVAFVASQPASTRTEWLTYGGYGLAAFLGLAAFGWVVERIVVGLKARHAEATAEQRPQPVADGGSD